MQETNLQRTLKNNKKIRVSLTCITWSFFVMYAIGVTFRPRMNFPTYNTPERYLPLSFGFSFIDWIALACNIFTIIIFFHLSKIKHHSSSSQNSLPEYDIQDTNATLFKSVFNKVRIFIQSLTMKQFTLSISCLLVLNLVLYVFGVNFRPWWCSGCSLVVLCYTSPFSLFVVDWVLAGCTIFMIILTRSWLRKN